MRFVRRDNKYIEVESPGGLALTMMEKSLRYRPPGYQFVRAYKKGFWDGFKSLLIKEKQDDKLMLKFPAGLLKFVLHNLGPDADYIEVVDLRTDMRERTQYERFPKATPASLVDVQQQAVDLMLEHETGIVDFPTGVGKGRIMGEYVRRLNMDTLVLVDKKDLLDALANEMEPVLGMRPGRVGDGDWKPVPECTIATIQTVSQQLKKAPEATARWLAGFGSVLVDEVHHAESDSYQAVLYTSNARFRHGLSATPFRQYAGKSAGLGTYLNVQAVLGPPIAKLSIQGAVDSGRIVPPTIYFISGCDYQYKTPTTKERAMFEWKSLNFRDEYEANIVNNTDRNKMVGSIALVMPGQSIILVERIEHGHILADLTGFLFVDGSTPTIERKAYWEAFKQGKEKVLIVSKIADEALDLPNMNNVILAGGGKSHHIVKQRLGRGMRSAEGKDRVNIFDFDDQGKYLSRHAHERAKLYEDEVAYTKKDIDRDTLKGLLAMRVSRDKAVAQIV